MQIIVLDDVKRAMHIMAVRKDRPDYALALIKEVFFAIRSNLKHPLKQEVIVELTKEKRGEPVNKKHYNDGHNLNELEKLQAISKIKRVIDERSFANHVCHLLKIPKKELNNILGGQAPFPVTFWNVIQKELSKFSIRA